MKILKPLGLALVLISIACNDKNHVSQENLSTASNESNSNDGKLYHLIKKNDSLLFQIGFNQIDTSQVAKLIADNFEFYHDKHGITPGKNSFLNSINSLRDLPFKTWRILINESMEVFPLYTDNSQLLYGAIQNGIHDFYQQKEGQKARKTSTAKFTHLWIIEDGEWKLKCVLSYDHKSPQ